MVGGGNRRDGGSSTVTNTNVFAALDTLRKKKKSDKDKASSKSTKAGKSKGGEEAKPQVFWAPAPLTVKLWADVDDEDDDDYYETTVVPKAIWGGPGSSQTEEMHKPDHVEESGSEDELFNEGDYVEEEHEHEEEEEQAQPDPIVTKPVEVAPPAPKETERQLSKKELKKKELAELEALLADFGVNPTEDKPSEATSGHEEAKSNGIAEKMESAPVESKSAKKKKKKASKEVKETREPFDNGREETEEDQSAIDVKERLKKMASAKKKKSSKEMDAAAKAAASEAAARSARLAAAKKKEKGHYNQQPIR